MNFSHDHIDFPVWGLQPDLIVCEHDRCRCWAVTVSCVGLPSWLLFVLFCRLTCWRPRLSLWWKDLELMGRDLISGWVHTGRPVMKIIKKLYYSVVSTDTDDSGPQLHVFNLYVFFGCYTLRWWKEGWHLVVEERWFCLAPSAELSNRSSWQSKPRSRGLEEWRIFV